MISQKYQIEKEKRRLHNESAVQKILAFVLSAALLICSFSIGASAQAGENEFAVSKIAVKVKTASATLSEPDIRNLVVAVYDEATKQGTACG